MALLKTPTPYEEKVTSLGDFLQIATQWQEQQSPGSDDGFLSQLWYRGVNQHFEHQMPGVYRKNFTERARRLKRSGDDEGNRLHIEREMLAQFRSAGAAFLDGSSLVDLYFTAQHFG